VPSTGKPPKNSLAALARELHRVGGSKVLLYIDEADHLIQQSSFQDALQRLLKDCPHLSMLVSTHQGISAATNSIIGGPVYGPYEAVPNQDACTAGNQSFKSVHVPIRRLSDIDAGRLFLRRIGRVITWKELGYTGAGSAAAVSLTGSSAEATYRRVGISPMVRDLKGHPRGIILVATCM
jgi:hypothetical protein